MTMYKYSYCSMSVHRYRFNILFWLMPRNEMKRSKINDLYKRLVTIYYVQLQFRLNVSTITTNPFNLFVLPYRCMWVLCLSMNKNQSTNHSISKYLFNNLLETFSNPYFTVFTSQLTILYIYTILTLNSAAW